MPRQRREGRHPRLARRRLVADDREGRQGRRREGHRVRPPGHGRQARHLHLVRRQGRRRAAGQGRRPGPEGQRQVRQEARHRRAQRRPGGQQLARSSRAATTRSSSRSTRTARSRRARTSSCPPGTTRRPARSSSRCSSRRATRSTASPPPTTGSPTPSSSRSRPTSSSRSRSAARMRPPRASRTSSPAGRRMTVWKDTRKLATVSAAAAIALLKGNTPEDDRQVGRRPGVHHPARVDHEGELQAALQGLLEAGRTSASAPTRSTASRKRNGVGRAVRRPHTAPSGSRHERGNRDRDADARVARHLEELRLGAGSDRGRLRGAERRGDGARRRQRRRQVDADQVHRRHLHGRRRRDPLRGHARLDHTGRRTRPSSGSRSCTRISRSATTSTSSRTCSWAARRTTCFQRAQRAGDGAPHRRDHEGSLGDDDPLDPAARRHALGRSAAVGRRRPRRALELASS